MKKLPITLIVLTKDEEPNLDHCLKDAAGRVEQIVVVDSGSTDGTLAIARQYGADVYDHLFKDQADQFNWALDNAKISGEWVLRLDADESISDELWDEIELALEKAPADVAGFYLKRRVYFMGRWIRHGGYYPTWLLRLFRKGKARSEARAMDEHLVLTEGRTGELQNDFKDENHKELGWWISKHNSYSTREAQAMLERRGAMDAEGLRPDLFGSHPERKRWLKENLYLKLPIFVRPFLYFFYRYVLRGGFLDGRQGFLFHFLQGLWYRLLVDVKYAELRKNSARA